MYNISITMYTLHYYISSVVYMYYCFLVVINLPPIPLSVKSILNSDHVPSVLYFVYPRPTRSFGPLVDATPSSSKRAETVSSVPI